MADPRLKKLTISCNVVKRIAKEKKNYEEEFRKETQKYEEKVAQNIEEHDLRMAKAILDESKMIIPDCQMRLDKALVDLNNLIQECEGELAETEQFKEAKSTYLSYSHTEDQLN
ncbi:Tubulin-specific chaperone A [Fasciola gigantica]|uniref:Tubulin-specific chaperone A n=2 Tax=Fasciola TaxID=6191 RepID=A0A4E0RFK5_FASHE|nr:Tubulin-specific chaperone A [Fasciola hepatica]TPP39732.1 Tubulin-specific chaperone A [Fasciola gigantica]